ncbi:uncharacterized protein LOC115877535 isoform X2 [Sitophilus oryzae]|uniref:Uncharacterized protein LOC115877535 isoform X2 n=1 Tax=Sitophilus oryzae TaxID=7048 RepID=A0A6J2XEE4_SITOR|nr:uncharacterized protein LOC115877535 isoform X2 [Sitophilus oryzae]
MGRIKCFICGVYNHNKNKIVSFHKFPCDGNRLKIWCDKLGRSTSDIQSNSFICSLHFSPEDFIYYGKPKRVRLTNTAEPTRNVEKFEENTHLTNPAHSINNVDRYEETARIPNFAQPICNVNRYEESGHLTSCAKPNYIVDQYYSQPICSGNRYEGTTHLTNWVESVYNADGCKESGNHDSETESSSPLCLSKQGYNSQIDDSPNIRNLPPMIPIKEEWNLSDISDTSRTLSVSDLSRTLSASDGSCNLTGSDNDEDFVPVLMGTKLYTLKYK